MAYLPKQLATWTPTASWDRPDNGEQIVFHLKSENKAVWRCGTYDDTERLIKIKHTENIYYVVPFEPNAVDYWMRIPSL